MPPDSSEPPGSPSQRGSPGPNIPSPDGLPEAAREAAIELPPAQAAPRSPAKPSIASGRALQVSEDAPQAESQHKRGKENAASSETPEEKLAAIQQRLLAAEQKLLVAAEQKLAATEQKVIDAEQKLAAIEQQVIDAEHKLAATEQQVMTTQQSAADSSPPTAEDSGKKTSNSQLRGQVNDLTHTLSERDAEIRRLKSQLQAAQKKSEGRIAAEKHAVFLKQEWALVDLQKSLQNREAETVAKSAQAEKDMEASQQMSAALTNLREELKAMDGEVPEGFEEMLDGVYQRGKADCRAALQHNEKRVQIAQEQRAKSLAEREEFLDSIINRLREIHGLRELDEDACKCLQLAEQRRPQAQAVPIPDKAVIDKILREGQQLGMYKMHLNSIYMIFAAGKMLDEFGTAAQLPKSGEYILDPQNTAHPYRRGEYAGHSAAWSVLCADHEMSEWDTSLAKGIWAREHLDPPIYSHMVPENSFWAGWGKGVLRARAEFAARLETEKSLKK